MSAQKIALVTGANKGLGLEISRQLAQRGYKVILTARDAAKGQVAVDQLLQEGHTAHFLPLDVSDSASIAALVSAVQAQFPQLDVLVNNAGIMLEGGWGGNTSTTVTRATLEQTFAVNFFGLVELTQQLLPLLQASPAARIINLSSVMGSLTLHADPNAGIFDVKPLAYDASKTALNQFTVHLAHALRDTKITVNSAHPGWVKTDMGTEHAPMTVTEGAATALSFLDNDWNGKFIHLGQELPW